MEVMEDMEDTDQLEEDWVAIAPWDLPTPHLASTAPRCPASLTHHGTMEWEGATTAQTAATMVVWVEAATALTTAIMI